MNLFVLVKGLLILLQCVCVVGKECTNNFPTSAFKYLLSTTQNQTLKLELYNQYELESLYQNSRRSPGNGYGLDWKKIADEISKLAKFNPPSGLLKEISLHDVRLDKNSLHWRAQETNLEYMLMLDVDRLVWNFRKTAGLQSPGKPYGGWEAKNSELRGHFVGHYLSASAKMWASTNNQALKQKMSAIVSALSACQQKIGTGYLSAFPSEEFDRFESLVFVWAPYYTIHKILAGLLDQHTIGQDPRALKMAMWMVDYFYTRVQHVIIHYSIARHYASLNEETGGMNDVLYQLYTITRDKRHLILAHLFDKPCFLGELAVQANDIADFHSNTHIPLVVGSQMRYEVTGDPLSRTMATYFMEIVNSSHSYATGGTSIDEHWKEPNRLASYLVPENEESCTTYNMLKVSRNLFRWTKEMAYADHYERALTNGVLSIQRGTEPGVMIYTLPLGPGNTKAISKHGWGTPFDSFWCCYGTAIESFSKLGDSIYFEEEGQVPALYVIQYISSRLNWKSGKILLSLMVEPVVSWKPFLTLAVTTSTPKNSQGQLCTLNLRIPIWTRLNGAKAALNNDILQLPEPGTFLSITRRWGPNDKLTLQLPIDFRLEAIKDDRPEYGSIKAILYGPYLLAGYTTGDWDIKTGGARSISDWITPIPQSYNNQLVTFSQKSRNSVLHMMNSNRGIIMGDFAKPGNNSALQATFRLIINDQHCSSGFSSTNSFIGKSVRIEPFDSPGNFLTLNGRRERKLGVGQKGSSSTVFCVVSGLDERKGTVSLELKRNTGCFLSVNSLGKNIVLKCNLDFSNAAGMEAASFIMEKGISSYHPVSFMAKGANRNFVLQPLMSFKNETYTAYFNVQP